MGKRFGSGVDLDFAFSSLFLIFQTVDPGWPKVKRLLSVSGSGSETSLHRLRHLKPGYRVAQGELRFEDDVLRRRVQSLDPVQQKLSRDRA